MAVLIIYIDCNYLAPIESKLKAEVSKAANNRRLITCHSELQLASVAVTLQTCAGKRLIPYKAELA